MKKIYIWGGWSRNYGDLAIWEAQSQMLQENSDEILHFIPINSDDKPDSDGRSAPVIDDALIDAINKHGNLFILGAGGQIMPRSGPYALSGYQVNGRISTFRRLEVPLIIEGFGLNVFPHADMVMSPDAIAHLKELCDIAKHVSVRDELTLRWMQSFKIRVDEVIDDPAMFCLPIESNFKATAPLNIGLNWAGDRLQARYGDMPVEAVIDEICAGIYPLMTGNSDIYYFPHVSIYDDVHYPEFKKRLGDNLIHINEVVPGIMPERLSILPFFVDAYGQMDVVLGTRWHSTIIPYGQKVPCVSYGNTSKNAALRDVKVGIKKVNVDHKEISDALIEMIAVKRMLNSDMPAILDIKRFSMDQHYKHILGLMK